MNFKNILAIGAHPDDIEYGCLGLLAKKADVSNIHIQILSMGCMGDETASEKRLSESEKALSFLNPKSFRLRKRKGILESDFHEILDEIEEMIETANPNIILAHSANDTHQEHWRVHQLVTSAARRKKISILFYSIVSNDLSFRPNFFVELSSEEIDLKIKQLALHRSQADKFYMQPEYIRKFHQRPFVLLHKMNYCEAYEVDRVFLVDN